VSGAGGSGIEVWISALLTLMVLSFLYRDNPLYKIAEHLLVGVSAAYLMVLGFWTTFWPNVVLKLAPGAVVLTNPEATAGEQDWLAAVPVILGLLMLGRLWPRLTWISRWPTAFAIGTTAGYNLIRYLRSDFLNQITATIQPSLVAREGGRWLPLATLDQVLILVGTVSGLVFFTYTRERTGLYGRSARLGLVFMMVTFGASFGYAVMGRLTVLIDRLHELLGDWLGLL
jgi:hypothetical protein